MDSIEKAKIRIEHWMHHNDHHYEDYEAFAMGLDKAGKTESARAIREMMEYTAKSTECLKKAMNALDM
jgi:hypothetical protein